MKNEGCQQEEQHAWMAYKVIAIKMFATGIPSFIIWSSFIITVVICGFAMRPMFMMMFTGLEESKNAIFDRKDK